MTTSPSKPAFSRPVAVATLPDQGRQVTVQPDETERQALAKACGLVAIHSLEARLRVKPQGSAVEVRGHVVGSVTQTCVVSLEPFDSTIDEPVDLVFMAEGEIEKWIAKHAPDPHEDLAFDDDPPDAIVDGQIDLGAITAEFLALGLDPYPRKPGVAFEPAAEQKDPSPFAALAQWKEKK